MLRQKGVLHFGEYLDLKTLVRKSKYEEVYRCPYCVELGKDPDTEGKFYYNTIKQIGHCFRCSTIIISDALRTPELIRQQLETVSDEEKYEFQKLVLDWASPIKDNSECLDYMTNTRGIYPNVLNRFNVLATRTPRPGVIFCNKTWKDGLSTVTDFMTIRNLSGQLRYYNIRDQVKPLLWTCHTDTDSVILVEGPVSGLSAYQHLDGLVSPLVMLGKTISPLQISQLKDIVSAKKINKIYIATDGGEFEKGLKVARLIYKALDHQDVFVLNLPFKKDPNSMTRKSFKEIWVNENYPYQPLAVNILRNNAYGQRR